MQSNNHIPKNIHEILREKYNIDPNSFSEVSDLIYTQIRSGITVSECTSLLTHVISLTHNTSDLIALLNKSIIDIDEYFTHYKFVFDHFLSLNPDNNEYGIVLRAIIHSKTPPSTYIYMIEDYLPHIKTVQPMTYLIRAIISSGSNPSDFDCLFKHFLALMPDRMQVIGLISDIFDRYSRFRKYGKMFIYLTSLSTNRTFNNNYIVKMLTADISTPGLPFSEFKYLFRQLFSLKFTSTKKSYLIPPADSIFNLIRYFTFKSITKSNAGLPFDPNDNKETILMSYISILVSGRSLNYSDRNVKSLISDINKSAYDHPIVTKLKSDIDDAVLSGSPLSLANDKVKLFMSYISKFHIEVLDSKILIDYFLYYFLYYFLSLQPSDHYIYCVHFELLLRKITYKGMNLCEYIVYKFMPTARLPLVLIQIIVSYLYDI